MMSPMPSPIEKYQALLEQGKIQQDEKQKNVIQALDQLCLRLHQEPKGFWFFKKHNTPKGIYVHGHVGRGKTFLMDLFVDSLDSKNVFRMHFHEFMLWFHKQLRALKNQSDPIDYVIKNLDSGVKVICLDEFLVLDITDAMILSRILFSIQSRGITLVTTSNIEPQDLYYGGLQRKKFLPAIDWLQNNMSILHLDGEKDFRHYHSGKQDLWIHPINSANEQLFEEFFSKKVGNEAISVEPVEINKRLISVIKRSASQIMFKFESLCVGARSASDYLQLCQKYEAVFVLIPQKIADTDRNTARRFITLIDVFYDNQQPLYVLSAVDFTQIYTGSELEFEMQRTHSRLTEMQSFD